jgi:predicted ATP-grasp superfamily ATP-dependent carboligase
MWTTEISNGKLSKGTMAICSTFLNREEKQMNAIWERANKISELGYKVHSAAMVIELVATSITDNAESGACWCAVDVLNRISDDIDTEVAHLMSENRQQEERIQKLEAVIAKHELKKKKKKDIDPDGRC